MPLSFTPIGAGQRWHGSTWTVEDEDELASMLARVATGQAATVERILHETGCAPSEVPTGGFQGARKLLTVGPGKSSDHRDGWVFQVISWLAAHLQSDTVRQKVLIRPPQMMRALPGQDGLIIEYSNGDIAKVVICEDKATKNPRREFRAKVLPEFSEYESGSRDHELIAGVTSILSRQGLKQADDVAASILWGDQRAYRVAVTVGKSHTTTQAQIGLFRGYDQSVRGDVLRRRVEIMPLENLRPWLQGLADKALATIGQHDV